MYAIVEFDVSDLSMQCGSSRPFCNGNSFPEPARVAAGARRADQVLPRVVPKRFPKVGGGGRNKPWLKVVPKS